MATWITHLNIADRILELLPGLDRRGFCVGSIAPDCNVENEDWTAFTPSREVTHWMRGQRKQASDCDAFCEAYLQKPEPHSGEEWSFLLGYYAHLLTDAAFQAMLRREDRVEAVWDRIHARESLRQASEGMDRTWDAAKKLLSKRRLMEEMACLEGAYLRENPTSGYLTEILPLKEFPDYLDYLPPGAIVRKIGVMACLPEPKAGMEFLTITPREYGDFVEETVRLVVEKFREKGLPVEIWDGYFPDGTLARVDLLRGRPIPEGLCHLVCEILVRHRDGDYLVMQRAFDKPNFGGYFEATAGGSALKGEDGLTCARRELLEETGISPISMEEIGRFLSHNTIYFQYLARTDVDKGAVRLQPGETVAYRWLTEAQFVEFVNSDALIPTHRTRYAPYFDKLGYFPHLPG